ncbi:MAG: class I SAM-dependent methyltransferase [Chloroflexota bacterium]
MPTDYEKLYQEQRHVLGKPTQVFIDFFDGYTKEKADVLDLGCGQGRDGLFIARLGHRVVGVDISETGIAQLLEDAKTETLAIEGVVADLTDYVPAGEYDVVVLDRTLHMLDAPIRLDVLARVSPVVRDGGFVLLADEKSNMSAFRDFFAQDAHDWKITHDKKSYICVQKNPITDK